MKTCKVFISGFVQNVGFRQFIKSKAKNLGIKGWVKNAEDNRVEALFQGSKKNIEKMIKFCEQGPFLAEVKNTTVDYLEDSNSDYDNFDIIH